MNSPGSNQYCYCPGKGESSPSPLSCLHCGSSGTPQALYSGGWFPQLSPMPGPAAYAASGWGPAGSRGSGSGGMLGRCLGGQPGSCGFLGPPRVLSSVATSEGPFVHPFIQKSGCNCAGYKAPSGPDFPPLPVAWLGEGFPGSWTAAFCPLLGSWGPISSFSMPNIYSSNPPLPPLLHTPSLAIHTDHRPTVPLAIPGHTESSSQA